MKWWEYFLF